MNLYDITTFPKNVSLSQCLCDSSHQVENLFLGLQSCQWMRCQYHSSCIQHRIGRAECVCPEAGDYIDPVCGSNGKTYINNEVLIQDSCQRKTFITSQQGACIVGKNISDLLWT